MDGSSNSNRTFATMADTRAVLADPRNWVAAKYLRSHASPLGNGEYERHSHDDVIWELEAIAPEEDAPTTDLLGMYSLIHDNVIYGMAIGTRSLAFRLPA